MMHMGSKGKKIAWILAALFILFVITVDSLFCGYIPILILAVGLLLVSYLRKKSSNVFFNTILYTLIGFTIGLIVSLIIICLSIISAHFKPDPMTAEAIFIYVILILASLYGFVFGVLDSIFRKTKAETKSPQPAVSLLLLIMLVIIITLIITRILPRLRLLIILGVLTILGYTAYKNKK
jgi:MFS family permease